MNILFAISLSQNSYNPHQPPAPYVSPPPLPPPRGPAAGIRRRGPSTSSNASDSSVRSKTPSSRGHARGRSQTRHIAYNPPSYLQHHHYNSMNSQPTMPPLGTIESIDVESMDSPSDRSDDSTVYPNRQSVTEQYMKHHFRRSQTMDLTASQSEKLGDLNTEGSEFDFRFKRKSSKKKKRNSKLNAMKRKKSKNDKNDRNMGISRNSGISRKSKSPHPDGHRSQNSNHSQHSQPPHRRQRSHSSHSIRAEIGQKMLSRLANDSAIGSGIVQQPGPPGGSPVPYGQTVYGSHLKTGSNGSDNSTSGRSTSHEIQESQTAIADQELDPNDSLNGHDFHEKGIVNGHHRRNHSNHSRNGGSDSMKPFRYRKGTDLDDLKDENGANQEMKLRNRGGTEGGAMIGRQDAMIPQFGDDDEDDIADPDIPDIGPMFSSHSEQVVKTNTDRRREIMKKSKYAHSSHPRSKSSEGKRKRRRKKRPEHQEILAPISRIPKDKR